MGYSSPRWVKSTRGFDTPGFAIVIPAVWTGVLVLTGIREQLLHVVLVSLIF
jgi:hypothetical protein